MQVEINNGDSGLLTRNNLNSMFTELYANLIIPIKLPGVTGTTSQAIPADTFVNRISINATSGSPTVRIGTTANGQDIMPDTVISSFQQINAENYFSSNGTIYITYTTGSGTLSFRFDVLYNFL